MILEGSGLLYSKIPTLLDKFAYISVRIWSERFKITKKKTTGDLWKGSCKNSNMVIPWSKSISWAERKLYAPGRLEFLFCSF